MQTSLLGLQTKSNHHLRISIGKSTLIFNDAMEKNHKNFIYQFKKNNMIRRSNKFECHTIDDQLKWI